MIEWIVWFCTHPVPYGLGLWALGVLTGYMMGRRRGYLITRDRFSAIVAKCTSRGKGTNGMVKAEYLHAMLRTAADR